MGITRGITYGSTEQLTNTKLHNLVDLSTLTLEGSEVATDFLASLASIAGVMQSYNLVQTSLASGAAFRYDGNGGVYGA